MRILLCSKLFYPSESIGSVRPTNFAIYLAKLGHDVTVITSETKIKYETICSSLKLIRASNGKVITFIKQKNEKRIRIKANVNIQNTLNSNNLSFGLFQLLRSFLSSIYDFLIDFDWYLSARKIIFKNYKKDNFDLVLSSFGPLSSFLLGRSVKSSEIARFWVSDFRDNMKNEANFKWLNLIYIFLEKRSLLEADLLTFVSSGQKEIFEYNNKVQLAKREKNVVIYNGFEEQLVKSISNISKNEKLTFLYAGQLYSGKRDFSMLFEALSQLVYEGKVNIDKIQVCYAGNNSSIFQKQNSKYKSLIGVFKDYGLISKKDSILLQTNADILIALTWNTSNEKGILTGKFFEYLQAQKPIISICCGKIPHAELSLIIRNLNLGVACESANWSEDVEILKKYLLNRYTEFINHQLIDFDPDFDKIKEFHFSYSVNKLNNYINNLMR